MATIVATRSFPSMVIVTQEWPQGRLVQTDTMTMRREMNSLASYQTSRHHEYNHTYLMFSQASFVTP
jgi:hypothetical protein